MGLTEEQRKIIRKCRDSPKFFIENFVKIETEEYGIIPFELFDYQKDLIEDLLHGDEKQLSLIKSRQIGASTLMSAYALWLANFHIAKSVIVVSVDLRTAKSLHKKVVFAWSQLPEWMRMDYDNKNMTELNLKNRSSIKALPFSKDKGTRSLSASLIILDEAHFIPDANILWKAIEPSISKSGKVIALSSPDAPTGWFYDIFVKTELGEADWKIIKLPWYVHPDRDQEWRDEKDRSLGKREARQEYDAEFGISGQSYFDPDFLERIKDEMTSEPIRKDGALWVWEEPIEGEEYIVAVDPAEGANDLSCIQVIKMSTLTQVAEYMKKIHYDKFNYLPVKVSKMYNDALLVIEDNSIGKTTISRSKDLNYHKIYKRGKTKKEKDILGTRSEKDGWNTNNKTRPMIIKSLEKFIETDEGFCTIRSERLLQQLMTFIEKNGKAQAQSDGYDDGIMAFGIGLFIYELRGVSIQNPDSTHDILQMYSAIQKQAEKKYKTIKDFDDNYEQLSDEDKEKEKLKKERERILKRKGDQFNLTNPFADSYMETYRKEFDF